MKEYNIRIKETLEKVVTVEALSLEHARHITEKNWKNGDYILDASDFKGVAFHAASPVNKDYER